MRRPGALAAALVLALALSGCAVVPPGTPAPTPAVTTPPGLAPTVSPTASPTASPVRPSWGVETLSHNDPALPVHVQWPVVPGAPHLTRMLAEDLTAREQRFLAGSVPNTEAPPELRGTWETVLDAPAWVGVRVELYEFTGASGELSTQVLYGEKMGGQGLRSIDLIAPGARQTAADAVIAALRAEGHEVLDELAVSSDARVRLFDDLVFGPRGELEVRVGEGVMLPSSAGVVEVTLAPSATDAVLSEQGVDVRDAAVGLTGPASPTPVAEVAPPAPAASVDCAAVECVALTFDDGPGRHTGRLLDDLAQAGVPATFFLLGTSARAQPDLVRRMVAGGHEVGNHTLSHQQLTKLGADAQAAEVRGGAEAIAAAGATPTVFRPPYGSHDATTHAEAGLPIVLWDVDTLDWRTRSTEATVRSAVGNARAGSIVLLHDIHEPTVDAVPAIVTGLRERGFTLVTVSQLLGAKEPGSVSRRR